MARHGGFKVKGAVHGGKKHHKGGGRKHRGGKRGRRK